MSLLVEQRAWQQVIDDQIALSRVSPRAPRRSTALNYPQSLYALVLAAARERDMSMTAYQRRATLSFAQVDTGFDWLEEMKAEPGIAPFGAHGGRLQQELNGLGCGYWRIQELGQW